MARLEGTSTLVEHPDYWELPLVGRVVTRCLVDYGLGLEFFSSETTFEVRIEGRFTLRESGGDRLEMTPESTETLGPALRLLRREVTDARAYKDGRLELAFSDGSFLTAASDEDFEAWEMGGGDQRVVCTPGGELAVWT